EVKDDPERLWRSDLPAASASASLKTSTVDAVSPDELAALDALGSAGRWRVFGRELHVTNLDKVLFPPRDRDTAESGDRSGQAPRSRTAGRGRRGQDQPAEAPLTKRDLLRYAAQIAPIVLPYLSRRALNLHRFPD